MHVNAGASRPLGASWSWSYRRVLGSELAPLQERDVLCALNSRAPLQLPLVLFSTSEHCFQSGSFQPVCFVISHCDPELAEGRSPQLREGGACRRNNVTKTV